MSDWVKYTGMDVRARVAQNRLAELTLSADKMSRARLHHRVAAGKGT